MIITSTAALQAAPPKFIPEGWQTEHIAGRRDIIRYVSPDRTAVLTMGDIAAAGATGGLELAEAHRPNEKITYRVRKGAWIVVSGYRGDKIFYRRADLACRGKRWHVIEVTYPRSSKQKLDATVTRISHSLSDYRNVCPRQAAAE